MKQSVPQKFAGTMEFVKEYLEDVVNQSWGIADREQNQLTFQVWVSGQLNFYCHVVQTFIAMASVGIWTEVPLTHCGDRLVQ